MKPKTLAKIIVAVVAVIAVVFLVRYFIQDAQRADRVTEAQTEQTVDLDVSPGLDLDATTPTSDPTQTTAPIGEEPTSDPTSESVFNAPTASLGSAKLPKKYTSIFGGKLSIRVPSTWCKTGKQPNVEVFFVDKGKCKAKNADHAIIVFSDLTTTLSSDLFRDWKKTSCGETGGGIVDSPSEPTLDGPIEMMLDGELAEFYRVTCADGSYNYAWLILPKDKLVTVENPTTTELRRAQAVLEKIRWN